jgi:hypothetical protein
MTWFIALYGGITLIAGTIVFLDYLGRRQQRKARQAAGGSTPSPHADDFWP